MESSSLGAVARRSSDGVERRPCTWALHVDRARFPANSAKHLPFGKFSVFIVWTCPRPLRLHFLSPLFLTSFQSAMAKSSEKKADKKADKKTAKTAAAKEATPAKTKPISSKEILAKANVRCLQ